MATYTNPTGTHQDHCELCGSTSYEDLAMGDQGYTACCNELICYDPQDCKPKTSAQRTVVLTDEDKAYFQRILGS